MAGRDFQKEWERALQETKIIRARVQVLSTSADTHVPYVLLSPSQINIGDTVVRSGEVVVQKPALIVPPHTPQFEGFDFGKGGVSEDMLINFLIVRGIVLPSMKYNNLTYKLEVSEKPLEDAIHYHNDLLQKKEDVHTGLITGPEDCWQFSLLIFICVQVVKNVNMDIKRFLKDLEKDH